MDIEFDIRGFLKPYERIEMTLDELEDIFVRSFDEDSTRYGLFEDYLRYVEAFQAEITADFTQWIDGSFISKKQNPNDIDLVTILDYEVIEANQALLDKRFTDKGAIEQFNLDAYIVRKFPDDHKKAFFTISDLAYWNDWFSRSKKDKSGRRFPKGYIEIHFGS